MKYVLQINNVTKTFGDKRAVDNASIHIKQGEIYGFIGRNGAGKTTFMKMICGLSTPTSGEIEIFGAKGKEAAENRRKIGSLIENPGIYEDMTAVENLRCKALAMGVKKDHYEESLLNLVGLGDTGHKKVKYFSLGMKQRLGIALAMVGNPSFLVLDEPINGLDPQGIAELRELFKNLCKNRHMTIMISSHILDELYKIADTFCFINEGKIIEELTKEELDAKSSGYIKLKVSDMSRAIKVLKDMGLCRIEQKSAHTIWVLDKKVSTAKMNRELVLSGIDVAQIGIVNEGIEHYYLGLTGGRANE